MKPFFVTNADLRDCKPFVEERRKRAIGGANKRFFDIAIALSAIIVLLPIMLLVAFLVWRHDKAAPFFAHTRIGHRGRSFQCLKFRSMAADSATILATLLISDPDAAREWTETQKLRNDPRVTPIGRILRTSSLDELPQLLNVLKGEMSIVGPRPIVTAEIDRYATNYEHYRACRPGLTGLWQISGRSDCGYGDRVRLDVEYASGWTFWRDLVIVIKTVSVVLGRRGSC